MLYICKTCNKEFHSKSSLGGHMSYHTKSKIGRKVWNTGLTKNTDRRINKYSQSISNTVSGKTRAALTQKHKNNISDSMKIAHSQGKAWNIGRSRWNNAPSYPEKFFMKAIENNFEDKAYSREFSVNIYSIDFAWPHKKKAIEIDGEQHQRFKEYLERDKRKDEYLSSQGWTILRIKWIDMYNNPVQYIIKANEFISR